MTNNQYNNTLTIFFVSAFVGLEFLLYVYTDSIPDKTTDLILLLRAFDADYAEEIPTLDLPSHNYGAMGHLHDDYGLSPRLRRAVDSSMVPRSC